MLGYNDPLKCIDTLPDNPPHGYRFKPPPPFNRYKIGYVYIDKTADRRTTALYASDNDRLSIPYARCLYMTDLYRREGIILDDDLEVDHNDNDRMNDSISNLRAITRKENKEKYNNNRSKLYVLIICPICQKQFTKYFAYSSLNKSKCGQVSCCSSRCGLTFDCTINGNSDKDVIRNWVSKNQIYKKIWIYKNSNRHEEIVSDEMLDFSLAERFKIEIQHGSPKYASLEEKVIMIKNYLKQGLSNEEISIRMQMSENAVYHLIATCVIITPDRIRKFEEIMLLRNSGLSNREIADEFNVSKGCIEHYFSMRRFV